MCSRKKVLQLDSCIKTVSNKLSVYVHTLLLMSNNLSEYYFIKAN